MNPFKSKLYKNKDILKAAQLARKIPVEALVFYIAIELYGPGAAKYIGEGLCFYDLNKKGEKRRLSTRFKQIEYLKFQIHALRIFRKYIPRSVVYAILRDLEKDRKTSYSNLLAQIYEIPISDDFRAKVIEYLRSVKALLSTPHKHNPLSQESEKENGGQSSTKPV